MGSISAINGDVSVEIPLQYTVNNSFKKSIIEGHTNSIPIPLPSGMGSLAALASVPGGLTPPAVSPDILDSIQGSSVSLCAQMGPMIDTLTAEINKSVAASGFGSTIPSPTFSTPDPAAGLSALTSAESLLSSFAAPVPPVPGLIGTPPIAQAMSMINSISANSGSLMAASMESLNVSSGLSISSPSLPTPPSIPNVDSVLGPITSGAISSQFSDINSSLSTITSALPPNPTIDDMLNAISGPELGDISGACDAIVGSANSMITDITGMMAPVRGLGNAAGLLSMANNPIGSVSDFSSSLPQSVTAAISKVDFSDISDVGSLPEWKNPDLPQLPDVGPF